MERPADYLEYRRVRAWELKQAGWTQRAIAAALGVTEGAVSRWLKRARTAEGGPEAGLRRRPRLGVKLRLSATRFYRVLVRWRKCWRGKSVGGWRASRPGGLGLL